MSPSATESSFFLSTLLTHPSILLLAPTLLLLSLLRTYIRLSHIPGPVLCRVTNIPRLLWVRSNRAHETHIRLHRAYGSLVRLGPNMVSVGDPAEMGTVYGFGKKWAKSDFYHALLFKTRGKLVPGIFATQDENVHRTLKKPVSSIYSMTNLVSFEPYVDTTMRVFCDQLAARFDSSSVHGERATARTATARTARTATARTTATATASATARARAAKTCDLGEWLQMFAFDVIGEITFSHRLGFLEQGRDVDGIMANIWNTFRQTSLVTQMPWLGPVWTNNPLQQYLRGSGKSPGIAFAQARIQERKDVEREKGKDDADVNDRDFLSRFMELEAEDPTIPPEALLVWTSSNITAGSDTTAILLRTIFYNLLRHRPTLEKLLDELAEAAARGELDELASWKQTRDLPYLDSCIKEAGRLHPPFGLPLERVVPPEGAAICGQWIPGGTIVGMSGWVVHRNREVFGEDCDAWRPERWLCDPESRKRMESSLLTFGAGHRSCLGKNISYLEIYKIVPTLLRQFEFELLSPEDWKVQNRWFVQQSGLKVRLRKRQNDGEKVNGELE